MKVLFIISLLSFYSCSKKESAQLNKKIVTESKTETDGTAKEKMFYAMAYHYAGSLKAFSPGSDEIDAFKDGMQDALKGEDSNVDVKTYLGMANRELGKLRSANATKMKEDSAVKVSELIAAGEYKTASSGLHYKIINPGNHKRANTSPEYFVKLQFKSSYLNGEVFEETKGTSELRVPYNGLLKAWREALKLIGEGGKIAIIAPPELAYGDNGAPPKIKGGETLLFEISLIDIYVP